MPMNARYGHVLGAGIAFCISAEAQAMTLSHTLSAQMDRGAIYKMSDEGISIVRMPPQGRQSSALPIAQEKPSQLQPRHLELTTRIANQPDGSPKGYLAVTMETLELPLGISLGLPH